MVPRLSRQPGGRLTGAFAADAFVLFFGIQVLLSRAYIHLKTIFTLGPKKIKPIRLCLSPGTVL
jgi:hypothetical protein